ncbi:MAG: hypothetical protein HY648_07310 [Acidobacteria bacterium]|nr:hypothetical protein [Acidobacteriota bacterium]
MRQNSWLRGPVATTFAAMVLTVGCATRTTTQTTTTAPSGPIQTTTVEPGVIPTGTTISVRTNEEISSSDQSEQMDKSFSAQIEQDVVDQRGELLIPKGSPAELVILRSSEGGVTGTPTMELAVKSVTVRGRSYSVGTAPTEQRGTEGLGASRRTAEMVGGGAILGTLIGAAVGGGKGAAIGAITGAAGGAAVQVLTRGKEINVPAETVMTFRLDQPWRLEGYSY